MKENTKLAELFMHKKPVGVILSLKDSKKYPSVISKEIDCTYTHTLKILNELHNHGLAEFNKQGRIKEVTLTEKGIEIAHDLEGLLRRLEHAEQD